MAIHFRAIEKSKKSEGQLILVSAITPTPAGEGKTTTAIGLAEGMKKLNKRVALALREPSMGPVFGYTVEGKRHLETIERLGYGNLGICMAKTQKSLSGSRCSTRTPD